MKWNEELYSKYKKWNEGHIEKVPLIIRDEYLRVFELLSNGQTYGAFFQIKDTFEILIKLLVLTALSEMLEEKNITGENSDIVFKLFEKPLSLGDWETISMLLKDKSKYTEINRLIDMIIKIFNKNGITKWRNDFIGHGALPNLESDNFVRDLSEKLEILHLYFKEQIINYSAIDYRISDCTLSFYYKNSFAFDIKFFSQYNDNKVYLFDSYKPSKKKSAFLNYSEGVKIDLESKLINNLVEKLTFDNNKRTFKANIEDDVYLVAEDNIIKEISKVDDFVRPEFIISEVAKFISENDKGVLLIQMQQGMGKTTLCNALDQLGLDRIKLDKCIVRGYYINDTYKSRPSTFVSEINDLFRIDKDGKVLYRGNIPYIDEGKPMLKSQVSALLSFYRDKYFRDTGKQKLVFFVDGLDEIAYQKNSSIFDYLPTESDLEQNIYIIYTARTNTELEKSFFHLNNITKIGISKKLEISCNNHEYKEMLINFLKKKYKGLEKVQIESYINMATSRFQYLKRICNTLDNNRTLLSENIFTNRYYEDEIDVMYNKFGHKYFERIIDILLLISLFNEPIRINLISKLLMSEDITFELLFYIAHLKLLLTSERTSYGNCIHILDSDFRLFIIKKYHANTIKISNSILSKCLEVLNEQNTNSFDDEIIYALSNVDILLQNSSYKISDLMHEQTIGTLLNIEKSISRQDLDSLKRVNKLQYQITNILDLLNSKEEKYIIYKAVLESNQAEVYDMLGFTDRAFKGFYESVKKLNSINIESFPYALLLSSRTYIKYALLCIKTNKDEVAIISLDNALGIYKTLQKVKLWEPNLEDYLYIYNNKGIAYQKLKQFNKAETEYNKAVSLLKDASHNPNGDMGLLISMVYLNRGTIYLKKGETYFTNAIEDFNLALSYIDNNETYFEQKAKILVNRATVLLAFDINKKDSASEDIRLAIDILEHLKEKNMLIDDEILMMAYINNGIVLDSLDQNEDAIVSYNKSITLGNKLRDEQRYINEYEFIRAHYLLALDYSKLNILEEEAETYKQALNRINIGNISVNQQELLSFYLYMINNLTALIDVKIISIDIDFIIDKFDKLIERKYKDLNNTDLLMICNIISDLNMHLREKRHYKKINEYLKHALSISDKIKLKIELKPTILQEIADCYVQQEQFDNALHYYNESIKMMRVISRDKFDARTHIAEMLYNRSVIYVMKGLYQKAYDDLYESVSLTNDCLEDSIPIRQEYVIQRIQQLKLLHINADSLGIIVR